MDDHGAEIALLISSYERPRSLACVLASIARQQCAPELMELVITDDGSSDESLAIVSEFAAQVEFPVKLTTHVHAEYQVSRCRNEGVVVSSAPYLLFVDGDCVLPSDHITAHLKRRRPSTVMAGDCCRLAEDTSALVNRESMSDANLRSCEPASERRRLRHQLWKAWFYQLTRHRTKPKLIGNNVGIWRNDYETINGYDERYVGWGCEDDDLRLRVRKAGMQVRSILGSTYTYHLWHPPVETCPRNWHDGRNVHYYAETANRPARCCDGLVPAGADIDLHTDRAFAHRSPFAEVVFHPGRAHFSGRAHWNVLIVEDRNVLPLGGASQAHLVLAREEAHTAVGRLQNLMHETPATRRGKLLRRAA